MSEPPSPPPEPLIDTRRFQVEEICRFFAIPPAALDGSFATFARRVRADLAAYDAQATAPVLAWLDDLEGKAP